MQVTARAAGDPASCRTSVMNEREHILMCPPDHFTVNYVINPWMDGNEGSMDRERALQQWATLKWAISEVADVVTIDPVRDLPDMVFTANAGVVYGDRAMASHFMPLERRSEERVFKDWFRNAGFELYDLPEDVGFEGAGDTLIDRGGPWVWAGYGFRTEAEALPHLERFFDLEVVPIRLVDERFYHIDTCLCPLTGGYLLYHPPAFDEASQREIERRVPKEKRIAVSAMNAGHFACNAVNVGDRIFLHRTAGKLIPALEEHGFYVIQVSLSEFLKAGGSAKCLTLKLTEPARR
jgi:N-dimethylarginine dimethylaminohydrolase